MSFLHLSLLAGVALAALPIAIHFSGRRRPRVVTFPALRFVRVTTQATAKGWSVKRWLLLILRALLLGLAAVAFASPRVPGALMANWLIIGAVGVCGLFAAAVAAAAYIGRRPPLVRHSTLFIAAVLLSISAVWGGWTWAAGPPVPLQSAGGPVAAAVIIDTSPTTAYRADNASRLERAQEMAKWIVNRMDPQSRVIVLADTAAGGIQTGPAGAIKQIERLQSGGRPAAMPTLIQRGLELVASSPLARHEVYVLTDLSAPQWAQSATPIAGAGEADLPLLQVIDVGSEAGVNVGFDRGEVSQDVAAAGSSVSVAATIRVTPQTDDSSVTVELLAERSGETPPSIRDGEVVAPAEVVLDRKLTETRGAGQFDIDFQIRDLPSGTNHYRLVIRHEDPLQIDDSWPFTVEGTRGGRTLLLDAVTASDAGQVGDDARVLALMFDPTGERVRALPLKDDLAEELGRCDVCVLYNPPASLPAATAKQIDDFVRGGGGLLVVLGDAIAATDAVEPTSGLGSLLPGRLRRQTRASDRNVYFDILNPTHGIWRALGEQEIPWAQFPIHRHWDLEQVAEDAIAIARYTVSGKPAIVEQPRGEGRVITLTTPVPNLERRGREVWNAISTSTDVWVGFGLMVGINRYLQNASASARNFQVGETAFLRWDLPELPRSMQLLHPEGSLEAVRLNDGSLLYGFTGRPGHYRLRPAGGKAAQLLGFSVHLPPAATDLTRVTEETLDGLLGSEGYILVTDRDQLQESVGEDRFGRELTPFVLLLIAAMLVAEQFMSRHYYTPSRGGASPVAA